ncbi:MAG: hypothetical protein JWL95_985, partial [Gemmatimonadetes bacterium]|nr:hypothetical protein [Gemmatimonadota bacterium]
MTDSQGREPVAHVAHAPLVPELAEQGELAMDEVELRDW